MKHKLNIICICALCLTGCGSPADTEVYTESTYSEDTYSEDTYSEPVTSASSYSEPVATRSTYTEPVIISTFTYSEPDNSISVYSDPPEITDLLVDGEKMIDANGNEYTIYYDVNDDQKKEPVIILSVTPEVIYWNSWLQSKVSAHEYEVGTPINICIYAPLYNSLANADGLIIKFEDKCITAKKNKTTIRETFYGMPGKWDCGVDDTIPIKNGRIKLCTPEELPDIDDNFFYPMLFLAASGNTSNGYVFADNITVDEADLFINQFILDTYNLEERVRAEYPTWHIDFYTYSGSINRGTCMRASINKIF